MDFVFPMEFISHWRRCGMVADFLANYQSFNFSNRKKAMTTLSTIINELLENAVKFSSDQNKEVRLSLRHNNNKIVIETINISDRKAASNLELFIQKLNNENVEKLFFDQIEFTATNATDISGLGLLTLIKDYNAQLGISIKPKAENNDSLYDIFVVVHIPISVIEDI